jgi:hypothetical protein
LFIDLFFVISYDKVVQNRWRVGWVVISRKNILRQKWYTFARQVTQWGLYTDSRRKLCRQNGIKPDWSNFPHACINLLLGVHTCVLTV